MLTVAQTACVIIISWHRALLRIHIWTSSTGQWYVSSKRYLRGLKSCTSTSNNLQPIVKNVNTWPVLHRGSRRLSITLIWKTMPCSLANQPASHPKTDYRGFFFLRCCKIASRCSSQRSVVPLPLKCPSSTLPLSCNIYPECTNAFLVKKHFS